MSKLPETPAQRLARTSEIYRRMQAEVQPPSLSGPPGAAAAAQAPSDPPPQVIERPIPAPDPQPLSQTAAQTGRVPQATAAAESDFVRRLLTRRPDRRELVLLAVVVIAVLYSIRPF